MILRCYICKEEKDCSYFYRDKNRRPHGFASACKECSRTRLDAIKYIPKDRSAGYRKYNLKRKFGITVEEYEILFGEQKGKCKICGKEELSIHHATGKPQRLAVDHCKETGKIRGLLCALCNKGIGSLLHNKEILLSAIRYLEETESPVTIVEE